MPLRSIALIGMGVMALGCGPESDKNKHPIQCLRSERNGSYVISYLQRSGNCGPIASYVGRLDPAMPLPSGCSLSQPDLWSNGDCTLQRSVTCVDSAGTTTHNLSVIEQEDDAGRNMSGTVKVTQSALGNIVICSGNYTLSAERQ